MKQLIEKFRQYQEKPFFFFLALPLALLPSLFYMVYFFSCWASLENTQEDLQRLIQKSTVANSKKQEGDLFLQTLQKADHYYVDKCLENQIFLEPELKQCQVALAYDPEDFEAKKRMEFLNGGSNRLRFSEQNLKNGQGFLEVEEVQQRPVEMNLDDLKKLLANIENVSIGPFLPSSGIPQLMIKNFELNRKKMKEDEELYLINLHLIKREICQ